MPGFPHLPSKNGMNLLAIYVLSGCFQPIIMRLIKDAGLADPTCQLYMLFYYLGPSFFLIPVVLEEWPTKSAILRACGVSMWDLIATGTNYMVRTICISCSINTMTCRTQLNSSLCRFAGSRLGGTSHFRNCVQQCSNLDGSFFENIVQAETVFVAMDLRLCCVLWT